MDFKEEITEIKKKLRQKPKDAVSTRAIICRCDDERTRYCPAHGCVGCD